MDDFARKYTTSHEAHGDDSDEDEDNKNKEGKTAAKAKRKTVVEQVADVAPMFRHMKKRVKLGLRNF